MTVYLDSCFVRVSNHPSGNTDQGVYFVCNELGFLMPVFRMKVNCMTCIGVKVGVGQYRPLQINRRWM